MDNITTFNFKELFGFSKIYVLVSGGFDSTYLYEIIYDLYPHKTYPVNCYNPYEYNKTVKKITKNDDKMIFIQPGEYKDVIKNSFLKLPDAHKLRINREYHKKIFPCCRILKHKSFKKDNRFREKGSVVISGIRKREGSQRSIFLTQMEKGTFKSLINNKPSFYLRHKDSEILYCYPFRDYDYKELPLEIKNDLWDKYPYLQHSGCSLCPILVLFGLKYENERYDRSVQYAKNLGVFSEEYKRRIKR